MRDQMSRLGLPPGLVLGEAHTEVICATTSPPRTPTTGAVTPLATTEISNLYPLHGPLGDMTRAELDQKTDAGGRLRHKAAGGRWFIDRLQFGGLTAHRQGMPIHGPEAVARIVRIYPAFSFQVGGISTGHIWWWTIRPRRRPCSPPRRRLRVSGPRSSSGCGVTHAGAAAGSGCRS